ncbi:hypothetical protein ISS85_00130 [Candidatus Microgenomates bacterium]|nr:hypothetical protein [Candidatus Microgenomates bacterium]
MFLRKSFKRDLLLLLGKGLDFWDTTMSYSAQRYFLYFGRWRKSTILPTISKLLSVGDIEKVVKNGHVYLKLTSQGNQKVKEDIPLLTLSKKPWDKKWRLVTFDIPEKEKTIRESLRRKLVSLGFGQWQRSVYISPYDLIQEINQFLKHQKLFNYAVCFEAKRLSESDDRLIAKKAWQLDKLASRYEKFIDSCQESEDNIKEKSPEKQNLSFLVEEFLELLRENPFLPKELLPLYWPYQQAQKSFGKILSLVS